MKGEVTRREDETKTSKGGHKEEKQGKKRRRDKETEDRK